MNSYLSSLQNRSIVDRCGSIKETLNAYTESLSIFRKEDYPNYYAVFQDELITLYTSYSLVENRKDLLKLALKAAEEASLIWTKEAFPPQSAMIQEKIKKLYSFLKS